MQHWSLTKEIRTTHGNIRYDVQGSGPPLVLVHGTPWLGTEGQHAFYRQMAQADQKYTDEIESRYGDVSSPTLIVWGENDAWIPVNRAHMLHKAIPGSRLELIPGAGHLVQEDAPTHLLACITDFLRGE
ncbi:alpha/beta hydrolase fold [Marinococcus luteus]|uniref:Alpha/beta hydrolase fold n=1 Tax=Marinococcus luteus TaxID=1122204 RepID=A0A1H2UAW5_9BACI|nr:alpha/beta hydrolase [Marinococcus luteus]SDW52749.1 alpha/beta hydrolase fold [Marinococcus luteus]